MNDPSYTAWLDAIHARHVRELADDLEVEKAANRVLMGCLYDALEGRVDVTRLGTTKGDR